MSAHIPCCSRTFEHRGELGAADAGHHAGSAHRTGADPHFDDRHPGTDQVPGSFSRDDVAGGHRKTQVQGRHRLDRLEHLQLVAVGGVHDQQVDPGLRQRLRLGGHAAVDAQRGRDPQPPVVVDRGGVDAGTHRPGPGQHTAECAVRGGQNGDVDRRLLEQFEDLAGFGVQWCGDEFGQCDVAYPGEAVNADGGRLRDQADRASARETPVDDHRRAMGTLVDQRNGVGHRVLRCQRHRGVGHQVAGLDEVHRLPHRVDRKVLRQHHDAAAAGHRLGHPPACHRGHVRHHDRDGRAAAVGGREVDVQARGDVRAVRDDEDVVVGQVVKWPVTVEETHPARLVRPAPSAEQL